LKTKQTYSVEFKEQALSKFLQRGSRTVGAVADELNVNVLTLRNWMRGTAAANRSSSSGHANVVRLRPRRTHREAPSVAFRDHLRARLPDPGQLVCRPSARRRRTHRRFTRADLHALPARIARATARTTRASRERSPDRCRRSILSTSRQQPRVSDKRPWALSLYST